ncbi:hypothetical protein [Fodinicola feengrottensis]|uniref:hypothetical protein n=1 Tax=Fodinicola feengrottensis TaxID=435914 RepID=UPI0013D0D568|nr:hypothetical protein [Fodinicola feengrottensis]
MTTVDAAFDEARAAHARLAGQSRWGEADVIVTAAIEGASAGHRQRFGELIHVPGGLCSDSQDALMAVMMTNRGAQREAAVAAARRVLAAPRWRLEAFWLAIVVLFAADEIGYATQALRHAWECLGRAVPTRDRDALALLSGRLAGLVGEPGRAAELLAGALDRGVRPGLRDLALAWRVAALADAGEVQDAYDDLLDAGFVGALDDAAERIDLLAARATLHAAADRLDLAYVRRLARLRPSARRASGDVPGGAAVAVAGGALRVRDGKNGVRGGAGPAGIDGRRALGQPPRDRRGDACAGGLDRR